MPDDPVQVQSITKQETMDWFHKQIASRRPEQVEFMNNLGAQLRRDPTDDEILANIQEVPQFKSKYRIDGLVPDQPPAPAPGVAPTQIPGMPPIGQRLAPPGTAQRRAQNAVAATLPPDQQPGARMEKELAGSIPLAAGVLATALAPEVGIPARMAIAGAGAAAGSVAEHGAQRVIGAESEMPLSQVLGKAGMDALNKGVVPEAVGSYVFGPIWNKVAGMASKYAVGRAAKVASDAIPESTSEVAPAAVPSEAGQKLLEAPVSRTDITVLQNASGLTRDRIEPLTKLKPWEMQARVDMLRGRLNNELSPVPDLNTGGKKPPSPEVNRVRENMTREIKALEILLNDRGVTPAGSPVSTPPAGPSPYPEGPSLRELPGARPSGVTDSQGAAMAGQPPAPVSYPKDYPQVKLIDARPQAKALEAGPSGWAPDPRAQTRLTAPEANKIASTFKVQPSKLIQLSDLPDEHIVTIANEMSATRKALLADPAQTITQPSGEPIRKDIVVDQLERWIGALHHLQLYSRGAQPPLPR